MNARATQKPRSLFDNGVLAVGVLLILSALATMPTKALDGAILIYHRFGEDAYPSTNTRVTQLQEQLAFIKQAGLKPLSLTQLAEYRRRGQALPDKAILITVDDAHRSFGEVGWPIFKAAGIPVTLFVSTDPVDVARQGSNYLTWDEIRALAAEGVTIGHHGASHMHMPQAGIDAAMEDIVRASLRFRQELGDIPKFFAYPYGEFSQELANAIKLAGFELAFAQYSSAYSHQAPSHSLPRFPINERYGKMDRFQLITQVKALPVEDVLPTDPWVDGATNPPVFGFSVRGLKISPRSLNCFPSHMGAAAKLNLVDMTPTGQASAATRVDIQITDPFPQGRSRVNCTLPAGGGRWYWFGRPFFRTGAED